MKLPALDDLIDEQRTIYEHPPDVSLFVAGPPGSGKTTLAVHRARFVANVGQTVVVVTKNRMLAALARELGGDVFETATMNRHVWNDHRNRLGTNPPEVQKYFYDWDAIDTNYVAAQLTPPFDHLVVDEGQNLPPGFFAWARKHGAKTITVFADEDQAIDDQRSSLQEICDAADLPDPVRLTQNHRNTPEIAAVAKHFHQSQVIPAGVVRRGRGGEVPRLVRVTSPADLVQAVVTRFRNRGEAIGLVVRTKQEAVDLQADIATALAGTRVDQYTSDSYGGAEHDIRILEPGVTILTGESVIGLEFDAVFLLDHSRSLPCTNSADRRRMYMLCARARDALVVVDGPENLTPVQIAALPPPTILAR